MLAAWAAFAGRAETETEARRTKLLAEFRRPASTDGLYPSENPFTPAKSALGKLLFFEPILSASGSRSCASCHNPGLSWGDGLPRGVGDSGQPMSRRSPTLLDVAWLPLVGWDGKFPDIEAVTFAAITGPANMGLDEGSAMRRLAATPGYKEAFATAFGDERITRGRIERAVATYVRTLVSAPSSFDRWVDGDALAISQAAQRGFGLFTGRAGCAACHSGWSFTDGSFHDIGTAQGDDLGRGKLFPSSTKLRYAFKVPTLRDVARRAPYMHDGSVPDLAGVVELYDRGGIERPSRSPLIRPLGLTADEKTDLVAFLRTLTGTPEPVEAPVLPR